MAKKISYNVLSGEFDFVEKNTGGGGGNGVSYITSFLVSDWVSSDAGETYSLDILHGLGTLVPNIELMEQAAEDIIINVHKMKVIDSNTVRLQVTQAGVDTRFAGSVKIS